MIKNNHKKIISLLIIVSFLTGNLALAANDQLNDQGLQTSGLLYLIAYIGSKFVSWAGQLVNWSLNLNSNVLNGQVIKSGWPIARDIANLGFVLAIILIAFATILRIESYEMKNTLWKLIVAALLVNFSLVIAGFFIDFTGVLTDFFVRKVSDPNVLASALANSLKVQSIMGSPPPQSTLEALQGFITGSWGKGLLEYVANLFFVVFFTGLSAITMLGFAAMLYIRYLYLTILLTLMPVVWMLWIWPDTQKNWGKWWSEFFRWVWFTPALSFFLYLAVGVAQSASTNPEINLGASFGAQTFSFADAGQTIGQMLAVMGILIGGMIAANSMGIAGAGLTISTSKLFGNWVRRTSYGAVSSPLDRIIERTTGKTARENLRTVTAKLSGIPIIGGIAGAANRQLAGNTQKLREGYEKYYEGFDKEARIRLLPNTIDPDRRAALLSTIVEKKEIKDIEETYKQKDLVTGKMVWKKNGEAQFESLMSEAIRRSPKIEKGVLAYNPFLAKLKFDKSDPNYDKLVQEATTKAIKVNTESMPYISLDPFANINYFASLTASHLGKVINERSFEDQQKLINILNAHLTGIRDAMRTNPDFELKKEHQNTLGLARYIQNNPAYSIKIDPQLAKDLNLNKRKKKEEEE